MADGEIIERLVVEFDAKVDKILDKLNRVNRSVHASAQQIEKDFANIDIEKSLGRVFDSSRLAVLEAGSARLRIFGSALEPLGPLGLAAAAGLVAVGAAFAQAKEAMSYGEDLEKSAKAARVSTDTLQEYRFALKEAGGEAKNADGALKDFGAAIGLAEHNLSPKLLKAFKSIGFDQEQLKSFKSVDEAIEAVGTKVAGLSTEAEKLGFARKLGLEGVLPLLDQGGAKIAALRKEAHELGVVMDADVVKQLAESNRQFEKMSQVVSIQMKQAFIDLAPAIVAIATLLANAARAMNDFVDGFKRLEDRRGQTLEDRRKQISGAEANLVANYGPGITSGNLRGSPSAVGTERYQELRKEAERIDAELAKRALAAPVVKPGGSTEVTDPPGKHGPKGRNPEEIVKASEEAIARATDAEMRAREALTKNTEARLGIALKLLSIETQQKIDGLEADVHLKKITRHAADRAEELLKQAEIEKARTLQTEAAYRIEDTSISVYTATVDAQIHQLENEASMAGTSAERRKIEDRILVLRQQLERDLRGTQIDRQVKEGVLTPGQGKDLKAALDVVQKSDNQKQLYDTYYSTIHGAMDAAIRGGWPGLAKYMADKLKSNIVDALAHSLTNILIGNKGGGGLLGGLLGHVFHVPGFASGTDSAPGGLSLVGERGPELVNLPKGSQVVPNGMLRGLGNATGAPMSAPVTILHFDLKGAVMTEDLLGQMNRMAASAQHQATMAGAQLGASIARGVIPLEMARRGALQLR